MLVSPTRGFALHPTEILDPPLLTGVCVNSFKAVADPEFPWKEGHQQLIFGKTFFYFDKIFAGNCMKMKEIGPSAPPPPPPIHSLQLLPSNILLLRSVVFFRKSKRCTVSPTNSCATTHSYMLMEFFLNEQNFHWIQRIQGINHWSMNWAQFKDHVPHMCIPGAVVEYWFIIQEIGHLFCKNISTDFLKFI